MSRPLTGAGLSPRGHENTLGVVPGSLGLLRQCGQVACETACLNGGRVGVGLGRGTAQVAGRCLDCRQRVGWCRFRFNLVRIERVAEEKTRIVDDRKLLVCSLGTKLAASRQCATSAVGASVRQARKRAAALLSRMSSVLGLVSGSAIRSSRVAPIQCPGPQVERVELKRRPASKGRPRIVTANVVPTTHLRCVSRKRSTGASAA